jgi:hypothetical protein
MKRSVILELIPLTVNLTTMIVNIHLVKAWGREGFGSE